MANFPIVKIVDNLTNGRTLFDFNPGRDDKLQRWVSAEEANVLGEPTWDDSPTGLVEGIRQITLPLRDQGRTAEAGLANLSELLTRTGTLYLQWQTRPDTESVWYELLPSTSGGALDFSRVWAGDTDSSVWQWKVVLTAKAFAIGAREDLTATSDLVQAGLIVNQPYEILDPIKGSAPAPLNLDIGAGNLSGWRFQLSSWAMDAGMSLDPWVIDETVNNGTMDGTFSGIVPGSQVARTMVPGQYRALVYVERLAGGGSCRVQVGVQSDVSGHLGSAVIPQWIWSTGRAVVPAGNTIGYWVDTGRLNLPLGVDPSRLPEVAMFPAYFATYITGNGDSRTTWRVSRLLLIPVTTPMHRAMTTSLSAAWSFYPETGGFMRVDGENRSVACVYEGGFYQVLPPPVVDGGFPLVFPGARNFLMPIPRVNDVESSTRYGGFGDREPTRMWYHPRHVHVGAR